MFRFLMRNENFEIVEVAFAVVAPWTSKKLFEVGVAALFLAHD